LGHLSSPESPDYLYGNAPKGRYFPLSVQRALKAEACQLRGDVVCVVCGEWKAHYQFHHIRPWSEKGRSAEANGVLLCPSCHNWADQGVLTPLDLEKIKGGSLPNVEPITDESAVCEIIEAAPVVEGREGGSCDEVARSSWELLSRLRRCETNRPSLRNQWRKGVARTQLRMAGALTSWLPADGIRSDESRRYIITILARNAARTGRALDDPFLTVQALHSLATNAKARGRLSKAEEHCNRIRTLLSVVAQEQPEYVAYTARNISVIYEDRGVSQLADELLRLSDRLRGDNAETLVRRGEVLAVRGELSRAGQLLERRLAMRLPVHHPIQEVIALRVYGIHQCLAVSIPRGLEILDQAKLLAEGNHLGHQQRKIEVAMHRLSSKGCKQSIEAIRTGKGSSGLPGPLRHLAG